MNSSVKINGRQMVMMLILCRMFSTLTYSPVHGTEVEGSLILIADAVSLAVTLILLIPLFWLMAHSKRDFLDQCHHLSSGFGRIVEIYFFLLLWLVLINTVSHFENFITNTVFIHTPKIAISITFLIACLYGAYQGLEGVARASTILFVFFIVSILFISFISIDNMNWINLKPPIEFSWKKLSRLVLESVSKNVEFVVLLVLYSHVQGKFLTVSLSYLFLAGLGFLGIGGVTLFILGDYLNQQLFPFYTVAAMVDSDILQRLDSLHMLTWVFVSYVKETVYLLAAIELLRRMLPEKQKKYAIVWIGATVFIGELFLSGGYAAENMIYRIVTLGFPVIIAIVVVPLILLLGRKKIQKKESRA